LVVDRLPGDRRAAARLGEIGEPDAVGRRLGEVVHHANRPDPFATEVGDHLQLGVQGLLLRIEVVDVPHLRIERLERFLDLSDATLYRRQLAALLDP
jgi:hypothetical protein